ncbi:MAG: hypothetical protein EBR23_14725, partial [Planctomycetia bacterium]|nr:hypothetical protein [Planctomycetia bacterium]
PPPPAIVCDSWEQDWPTLREAWNTDAKTGRRAAWRSSQPPAAVGDRLRESGWLGEAIKAIPLVAELRQFDTPVTLGQFCQPGWVAKVLGGYFRDRKREPAARGPARFDDRPPPQEWTGDDAAAFERTKRAMAEKLRAMESGVGSVES